MGRLKSILAALIILSAISCSKDNVITRNTLDIGAVVSPTKFVTDAGLVMNIVENNSGQEISIHERAILLFDVLRQRSGSEYDIRVLEINKPLMKDIARSSSADQGAMGNDPIFLRSGWFSGGYINIEFLIKVIKGSSTKHVINMVYEEEADNADTLHFTLRHNGLGDVIDFNRPIGEQVEFVDGRSYATFPIRDFLPASRDEMPVAISYSWYDYQADGSLPGKVKSFRRTGVLRR